MIALGAHNTLTVARETGSGLYLQDNEDNQVLLPFKYVPEGSTVGDTLTVFCYLDNEGRPIATTMEPTITVGEFQMVRVAEITRFGAFLEWGIEKHLLVPFAEQRPRMEAGRSYLVYCFVDPESGRLVASNRVERYLSTDRPTYAQGDEVEAVVYRQTPLGWQLIIDDKHLGLVFNDQVFKDLVPGQWHRAVVKKVRSDGKIDLSLQPLGERILEPAAEKILEMLQQHGGFLPLHDKSDPESIRNTLQMSKKAFKKGVGHLYKLRRIALEKKGIRILKG